MKKCNNCGGSKIGWILVVIGALNWGLVGIGMFVGGDWNVVNMIFGGWMWLEALIYLLVGIGGVIMIFGCRCRKCKAPNSESPQPMSGDAQGM